MNALCGHTHHFWVCVAPAGHELDKHYFVAALPDGLVPAGEQMALL